MVLIISTESDLSTGDVMEWINYLGESVYRINGEEFMTESSEIYINLSNEDNLETVRLDESIDICGEKVKSIWFRRDILQLQDISKLVDNIEDPLNIKSVKQHLKLERKAGKEGYYSLLKKRAKKILGSDKYFVINKIEILSYAKDCGLDIPSTMITDSKGVVA